MNRILFALLFALCLLIGVTPRQAHADSTFGTTVLGCFHPDAKFTSMTYARGRGHHTWTGWIKFHEGRAASSARDRKESAMSFVMDMKTRNGETFFRIMPLMDDGLLEPASGCYLREWQRY